MAKKEFHFLGGETVMGQKKSTKWEIVSLNTNSSIGVVSHPKI